MSLTLLETARYRRRTALLKIKSGEAVISIRRFHGSANKPVPIFRSIRSRPRAAA